ncbi:polysaccharide deacetylase family protein [Pedobacter sp. P351]|uniref:polysaccharide deacetylase family protein n=1 Tax=Pedobacter superstes TaxID=3133441 RepID=UPI0030B10649
MYFVKTPFFLRWMYPGLVWKKPSANSIYITFDDGPIPEVTPFALKALAEHNAKATFFCIGDNVRKHPEIYQEVIKAGHSVGNHTFNHLNGWNTDDEKYLENIDECADYVTSDLFRPPYGKIKKSQIMKLKILRPEIKVIMWDVLSGDFDQNVSPEKCLKNLLSTTVPGSIIVFHDSLKAFDRLKYVLPKALDYWSDRGFLFKNLN